MFGLFKKKARYIKAVQSDIAQICYAFDRLYNDYERYSLASAWDAIREDMQERFKLLQEADEEIWLELVVELQNETREAQKLYGNMPGLAGEGGRAGLNAIAIFAFKAHMRAYSTAESNEVLSSIENLEADFASYLLEHNDA